MGLPKVSVGLGAVGQTFCGFRLDWSRVSAGAGRIDGICQEYLWELVGLVKFNLGVLRFNEI